MGAEDSGVTGSRARLQSKLAVEPGAGVLGYGLSVHTEVYIYQSCLDGSTEASAAAHAVENAFTSKYNVLRHQVGLAEAHESCCRLRAGPGHPSLASQGARADGPRS